MAGFRNISITSTNGAPTRAMDDFAFNLLLLAIASDLRLFLRARCLQSLYHLQLPNLNAGWIQDGSRPCRAAVEGADLSPHYYSFRQRCFSAPVPRSGAIQPWVGFIFAALILPVFIYRPCSRWWPVPGRRMDDLAAGQTWVSRGGHPVYLALARPCVVRRANVIFQPLA